MKFYRKHKKNFLPQKVGASSKTEVDAGAGKSNKHGTSIRSSQTSGTGKDLKDLAAFNTKDVRVVKIHPDGRITLLVTCNVDTSVALKNNVTQLSFQMMTSVDDVNSTAQSAKTPDTIVKNMQTSLARSRLQTRNNIDRVKKKVNVDLTSVIDNSTARFVAGANSEKTLQLAGTQQTLSFVPLKDLSLQSKNIPVLQTPTLEGQLPPASRSKTEIQLMNDMLMKDGKPPSDVSLGFIPFTSTESALGGVSKKNSKSAKRKSLQGSKTADNVRSNQLLSQIVGGPIEDVSDVDQLSRKNSGAVDSAVVSRKESSSTEELRTFFDLNTRDLAALGNSFNVVLNATTPEGDFFLGGCKIDLVEKIVSAQTDANNDGGLTTSTTVLTNTVDITSTLDPSDQNAAPPSDTTGQIDDGKGFLPGSGLPGLNTFDAWVTQLGALDDGTRGWDMGGSFTGEDDLKIPSGGGTIIIRTTGPSFSPPSPTFSDRVIPSSMRHLATANSLAGPISAEVDNRFMAVSAYLTRKGITIDVRGFQTSGTICLVRKDLTLKEKDFSILPLDSKVIDATTKSVIFIDTAVKEDHAYEYRVKLSTREGRSIFGSGTSMIVYKKLVDNASFFEVTQPEISYGRSGNVDVQFDVTSQLSDNSVSTLIDLLKNQGLDSYFSTDLLENREKLRQVIVYQVDRIDLTKGVTESLGIFKGGTFSDRANRVLNNASALRLNKDYKYVISLLARDPDAIIPSATRPKTDKQTKNDYDQPVAKFLHPTTLKNGTLRSQTSIDNSTAEDEFHAGFIGSQKFADVSTKIAKPHITSGTCSRNAQNKNEIKWKVEGNAKEIDHFIIVADKMGMRSIVGRVHAFSHNNTFRFIDRTLSDLAGDVLYFVLPVYLDKTFGDLTSMGRGKNLDIKRKKV